jgi:protein SCO1
MKQFDMKLSWRMTITFFLLLFAFCVSASAQGGFYRGGALGNASRQAGRPDMLKDIGIDQKLDGQLPLDITLRDETGEPVQLKQYFGEKPVVLALVYYTCPMLCNQVLNGLTGSLETISFNVGKEFNVVAVSFDARETPEQAAAKKQAYMRRYNRAGAAAGWHFLTGDQAGIDRLTESVGFRYAFDSQTNQFAHASAIMVVTPQGKLARYFYGIEYAPKDLRLGLVEASQNKIGNPVDQLLLYCYHYDPATGKYGAVVMNMIRLGGALTLVAVVALLIILRRREIARTAARLGGTA